MTATARAWDRARLDALVAVTRLRNRIRANGAFSIASGLFVATAGAWVAGRLGVERSGVVRVAGLVLAVYGLDLLVVAATRWRLLGAATVGVVAADLAWVAGTVVAVATGWGDPGGGRVLLAAAGVVVAGFAVAQGRALGAARRAMVAGGPTIAEISGEAPATEAIRVETRTGLSRAALWAAVSDHELFGRLALNLDRVEVVSGVGTDLVRRCVAKGGRHWYETCTIADEGHRRAVEVDTSTYPYPLDQIGALSYVTDDEEAGSTGRRVGIVFQLRARKGLAGQAMMLFMQASRPLAHRIVRGWVAEAEAAGREAVAA
jgi:hypothetical protein